MLPDKAFVLVVELCGAVIRHGTELLCSSDSTCEGAVLCFTARWLAALSSTAEGTQALLAVRLLHCTTGCDLYDLFETIALLSKQFYTMQPNRRRTGANEPSWYRAQQGKGGDFCSHVSFGTRTSNTLSNQGKRALLGL